LLKIMLIVLLLLTGCASPPRQPTVPTAGLKALLNDGNMVWLGQHLDDQEWGCLSGWLTNSLTPYVTELEYDAAQPQ